MRSCVATSRPPQRRSSSITRLSLALAAALGTLPEAARTALLLAASGYPGAEIAAAIGRSDTATRTMMSRARLRLRDSLAA